MWRLWQRAVKGLAAALLLVLSACSVTPVPEPPSDTPQQPNLSDINGNVSDGIGSTPITLTGTTGALQPNDVLWVVNLDTQDQPAVTTAGANGSFSVTLPTGSIGQELRLQARRGSRRSNPVDALIVTRSGRLSPSQHDPCLSTVPRFELAFGNVALGKTAPKSIVVQNACSGDVVINSAALRRPAPAFGTPTAFPLTVPSGSQASIEATFTPSSAGLTEVVLLVHLSGALSERRAITLYGFGG